MTLSALGTRYAHALADVVTAPGAALRPEAATAELQGFAALLAGCAELRAALTSPAVPPGRKRAVVERLARASGLSKISSNFLYVLIDHRRIALLAEILHAFELIVDERLGFARAEVTSAAELSVPQRNSLTTQLERVTGKKIRPRFAVDGGLIGGAMARIGSTVYDGSVRGRLEKLGRRLSAEA